MFTNISGLLSFPENSVTNNQNTPRNIPEERKPQLTGSASLKPRDSVLNLKSQNVSNMLRKILNYNTKYFEFMLVDI
jgi:hypothetical protein